MGLKAAKRGRSNNSYSNIKITVSQCTRKKGQLLWRHVLWPDETKLEAFGYNNHSYIWRKKMKYDYGRLMLCGHSASGGTGALYRIDINMNKIKY